MIFILNIHNIYHSNNARVSIKLKPFTPASKFVQSKISKLFKNISIINLQLQTGNEQISYCNPLHIHQELTIGSFYIINLYFINFKNNQYNSFTTSLTSINNTVQQSTISIIISYCNPLQIHQELIIGNLNIIELYLWIIFKTRIYSISKSHPYELLKLIIKIYTFILLSIPFLTILYFKKQVNRFYNVDKRIREICQRLIDDLGMDNEEIKLCYNVNNKLGPKIMY